MSGGIPINIFTWLAENQDALKPPVSNKQLFASKDFIVMIVAGPNNRTDFHYNETSEFFYQLKGSIYLDLQSEAGVNRVEIKEGEMYLLDPKVEHRPIRPADTIGIVIEKVRNSSQTDALAWYCKSCNELLFKKEFVLESIDKDLLPVIDYYQNQSDLHRCSSCGTYN